MDFLPFRDPLTSSTDILSLDEKKWICRNLLMANMSQKCENYIRNKSGARIVNATFAYGFDMGLLRISFTEMPARVCVHFPVKHWSFSNAKKSFCVSKSCLLSQESDVTLVFPIIQPLGSASWRSIFWQVCFLSLIGTLGRKPTTIPNLWIEKKILTIKAK